MSEVVVVVVRDCDVVDDEEREERAVLVGGDGHSYTAMPTTRSVLLGLSQQNILEPSRPTKLRNTISPR